MAAALALLGTLLPAAAAWGLLEAAGADALAKAALLCAAAALNALRPLGGGMAVDGTWRVRWGRREWTFDGRRSRREAALGPLWLGAATTLGFVAALPALLAAWALSPAAGGLARELAAAGSALALLAVAAATHRPELPLSRWRRELEAGGAPDRAVWGARLTGLAARMAQDGAVGHVGGIGALTVGLHEHLDGLEILGRLSEAGFSEALPLAERALGHLASRREPGGFPVYPGAAPRAGLTARAERALVSRARG